MPIPVLSHVPVAKFIGNDGYNGKKFNGTLVFSSDGRARFEDEAHPGWYMLASTYLYQNAEEVLYYWKNHRSVHFPPSWVLAA